MTQYVWKWAFPNDNLRHSIAEYYWEKPARKACNQGETWTQEAKLVACDKPLACFRSASLLFGAAPDRYLLVWCWCCPSQSSSLAIAARNEKRNKGAGDTKSLAETECIWQPCRSLSPRLCSADCIDRIEWDGDDIWYPRCQNSRWFWLWLWYLPRKILSTFCLSRMGFCT